MLIKLAALRPANSKFRFGFYIVISVWVSGICHTFSDYVFGSTWNLINNQFNESESFPLLLYKRGWSFILSCVILLTLVNGFYFIHTLNTCWKVILHLALYYGGFLFHALQNGSHLHLIASPMPLIFKCRPYNTVVTVYPINKNPVYRIPSNPNGPCVVGLVLPCSEGFSPVSRVFLWELPLSKKKNSI